ncbi:MAG: hypothetical protein Kow0031_13160 [Anaerolineae bacterium]
METFLGLECVSLKNSAIELLVTQSTGPRIIRLGLPGGSNLLAELPDLLLDCPGRGQMHLWGGHRLWHSPEVKQRTYLPDDQPVSITPIENGLLVVPPLEAASGIQKTLRLTLPDDSATVVIDHTLQNNGLWPVELSPWAITMMKPGGTAILPQPVGNADPDGVLPNRRLALWPYTDINSPYIQWGDRFVFIHARGEGGPLKVGYPNPAGWLAYHINGTLFVKQADYLPDAVYPDFGSSTECYCRWDFIELETLGPVTTLAPGEAVTHRETWRLFANVNFEPTEDSAQALAEVLGL